MKYIKILSAMLCFSLLSLSATGCSNTKATADNSSDTAEVSETSTIRLINSKSEVDAQLQSLASAYQKETGNTVNIESLAAGVDVQAVLKGYYLADNLPDIIVCEASSFASWDGLLADLSDQDWVKDTDAAYSDPSYGTLGFPYTTEAIGLIYNADLLEKAGVDVSTITGPDAFASALEKIDSQKETLGLTAVVGYYAEKENLGWSAGNHIFGAYLDSGLSRSDTTYLDKLSTDTPLDEQRFANFARFIGLLQQYSDPDKLLTGSYEEQLANFSAGKYAFITQGSWIGTSMIGENADNYAKAGNFKVGMLPYVFEDGIDTLLTNSPSWWAVSKEGQVEAAKAFLAWCASESGQKILVEEANFISPFKSCKYVASDPIAEVVSKYLADGKTSSWHWMEEPEGLGSNALAPVFYDYAAGTIDESGFADNISTAIKEY